MKFSKSGRVTLASVVSLALGFGVIACAHPNTINFLSLPSSKQNPGQINAYKVDSPAGALIPIPNSPYNSGGANPVADATSPNGKNLYVVNHDSNTVVVFNISTDGSLSQPQSCTVRGSLPTQLTINRAGTYLYVVETYQPGFSATTPGPGALVVFPVDSTGQLGVSGASCTPVANGNNAFFPVGNNPVGVNVVASNTYVYVANQSDATISAFQAGSTGALSAVGTHPVGAAP